MKKRDNKKLWIMATVFVLAMGVLAGCGSKKTENMLDYANIQSVQAVDAILSVHGLQELSAKASDEKNNDNANAETEETADAGNGMHKISYLKIDPTVCQGNKYAWYNTDTGSYNCPLPNMSDLTAQYAEEVGIIVNYCESTGTVDRTYTSHDYNFGGPTGVTVYFKVTSLCLSLEDPITGKVLEEKTFSPHIPYIVETTNGLYHGSREIYYGDDELALAKQWIQDVRAEIFDEVKEEREIFANEALKEAEKAAQEAEEAAKETEELAKELAKEAQEIKKIEEAAQKAVAAANEAKSAAQEVNKVAKQAEEAAKRAEEAAKRAEEAAKRAEEAAKQAEEVAKQVVEKEKNELLINNDEIPEELLDKNYVEELIPGFHSNMTRKDAIEILGEPNNSFVYDYWDYWNSGDGLIVNHTTLDDAKPINISLVESGFLDEDYLENIETIHYTVEYDNTSSNNVMGNIVSLYYRDEFQYLAESLYENYLTVLTARYGSAPSVNNYGKQYWNVTDQNGSKVTIFLNEEEPNGFTISILYYWCS